MEIFNWFGSILGYLLWFLYEIIPNYGVAIILFTIITKLLLLPFSVKQQKSMAANSKMAAKQQEIRTKYANDRLKMQEEMQKLMEQEGVNPTQRLPGDPDPVPDHARHLLHGSVPAAERSAYQH